MKKPKITSMWAAFAVFVFFIILTSSAIIFCIAYVMVQLGYLSKGGPNPLVPIAMFFVMSVLIATAVNFFVGKKVLKPISAFSKAMMDVAKGDFSVQLQYDGIVEELNEMSSNFNTMVHELGNIETLRSDFVVSVSHEFKAPLTSIEGYATIVQNPELTDEQKNECAQIIIESTKQLAKLSSNILMISDLENKEIITRKAEFRLDEQIRQAILLFEPIWGNKKIEFNIELNPACYYGNAELMMQIWINVIGNSIKFTPKNGEISIGLKDAPDHLQVIISDTGAGMSPEVQKHIFDKFYQADRSGSTDGNGLGLSLVKRIMDLCQGSIQVDSELDRGTTFILEFPKK
jgi:signal transduction histidine kinase